MRSARGKFCGMARIASPRRTASRAGPMISSLRQISARIFSRIFSAPSRLGVNQASSPRSTSWM
jgi:hypothetical protein